MNGTRTPCEGPSQQQWGIARHPVTATVKWNMEVNNLVTDFFYRRIGLKKAEDRKKNEPR